MSGAVGGDLDGLVSRCLLAAIRREACRILEEPAADEVAPLRRVERLMRIGLAQLGAGRSRPPSVQVHGLRPDPQSSPLLPELMSVRQADLLAARASDHLADALRGDPAAREAIETEARRMLSTEEILI